MIDGLRFCVLLGARERKRDVDLEHLFTEGRRLRSAGGRRLLTGRDGAASLNLPEHGSV